ncbi:uncharacterized protein Z518_02089 [Rhinocladiella mackenziei CBS 650.93]|uniref:Zn(2)-C6 fungal-type domain-containing protein n=1 Tax=Rhinocladiella mackenziei CBS 650.93 TaxID=1442369 RepID=A0A0D2IW19_9EURO|nr:uncharacterized protein Z518_02089 [Rhinocladiella mackenziei CBS 650.93]KIX07436.1 hypothetical protein Z518_02089 [Rhinocladiella mackenziei CBS 650.93]
MSVIRPRQTCTECSLRRQKCDRNIPCARCIKRGVADKCTRYWPGGYNKEIHRVYPRKQKQSPSADVFIEYSSQPIAPAPTLFDSPEARTNNLGPDATWAGSQGHTLGANEVRPRYSFSLHDPPWVRRSLVGSNASRLSWVAPTGLGFNSTVAANEAFLQMLLPSPQQIWYLVDYHELCLLWYHGCYHGPTFRWELSSVLTDQEQQSTLTIHGLHLQWLALLFSIMAGSLTCATDRRLESWGFSKQEATRLSLQWYKATISCLNQAEFTSNHNIYSIHAIATLTMSAHSLGHSSELSVLLGAALSIARSLGLDRLHHDPTLEKITNSSPEDQRHKLLKREMGRRLWSQLCVQDWMSLPFFDSHTINPLHFTTTKPSSRDHLTMDPIPATLPTYISYGNYLFEIAQLMAGHHAAMLNSTTQFTKYEHVLGYDARMRSLATQGMPRYFHVVEPIDPSWPEWIPWARRSLTICFAHKIIMIHRAFIRQSFTNPAYSITRMTSMAAAKTILNEAKGAHDIDGPIIWVDKAFCVVAGIILCLDLFHRPDSDSEFPTHKTLVTECIELLRKFDTSIVAVRGARLLNALIMERERVASSLIWPPRSIKTSGIFKSLATDGNESQSTDSEHELDSMSLAELFPPQAGFCNRFLFEELLNFDNTSHG